MAGHSASPVLQDGDSEAENYTDIFKVHQLPALAASISQFGSPEGGGSVAAAKSLDDEFNSASFMDNWGLASVQAAFRVWWLAEYSGFFGEHYDGSLLNFDLDVGKSASRKLVSSEAHAL